MVVVVVAVADLIAVVDNCILSGLSGLSGFLGLLGLLGLLGM